MSDEQPDPTFNERVDDLTQSVATFRAELQKELAKLPTVEQAVDFWTWLVRDSGITAEDVEKSLAGLRSTGHYGVFDDDGNEIQIFDDDSLSTP